VKRLNPRRVKLHRNYTVGEAARLYDVHKNSVRGWLGSGLEPIDDRRPLLILGRKLSAFLYARRQGRRQRCKVGQLYCVRCRAPKAPTARMADYVPITSASGNLRGICPDCSTPMFRRVSLENLATSLNSDFSHEPETHANAQSGK
jgi:hypothetical protein